MKFKLNTFLILYIINLIIVPWFPYLNSADNYQSLIFNDPFLLTPYLGIIVLTILVLLIRNKKWNSLIVRFWLFTNIFAALGAYYDYYINSFEFNIQLIGSAVTFIILFGPLAIGHWLLCKFGKHNI
jgi:hypothetical protein